jgi:hypothetical protein
MADDGQGTAAKKRPRRKAGGRGVSSRSSGGGGGGSSGAASASAAPSPAAAGGSALSLLKPAPLTSSRGPPSRYVLRASVAPPARYLRRSFVNASLIQQFTHVRCLSLSHNHSKRPPCHLHHNSSVCRLTLNRSIDYGYIILLSLPPSRRQRTEGATTPSSSSSAPASTALPSPAAHMLEDLLRGFAPDDASLKAWRDIVRGQTATAAAATATTAATDNPERSGGASAPFIVADLARASGADPPSTTSSSAFSAAADASVQAPDADPAGDTDSRPKDDTGNNEEADVGGTGPHHHLHPNTADRTMVEEEAAEASRHGYRLFLWTHCLHRILAEVAVPILAQAEATASSSSAAGGPGGAGSAAAGTTTAGAAPDAKKARAKPKGQQTRQQQNDGHGDGGVSSSPVEPTSLDDVDRLSLVLTTLAFNVASFVEQHSPGPRRSGSPNSTTLAGKGGSSAAVADADVAKTTTTTTTETPAEASLLLNDMVESARPVVSRAVLFATAAALAGMRLLLLSGDVEADDGVEDDVDYHDGSRRDHETVPHPTTGRVRNRSWTAGSVALEMLLEWGQDPIHASSIGGGGGVVGNEDAKIGSSALLAEAGAARDGPTFGEDLARYETRRTLQDWLRDRSESDADRLLSRRLVGAPLCAADLPASVVAGQDWSHEIQLWNAFGGAYAAGSDARASDTAAQARTPPPSQPARVTRTTAAASVALSVAAAGPPASTKGTKKRPPSAPKAASKKRRSAPVAAALAASEDRTVPNAPRSSTAAFPASQLGELLRDLVVKYEANRWSMDGRIPPKKWAPVALQWQMSAAANLMTTCLHLLKCVQWRRSSIGLMTMDITDAGLKIILARRLLRLLSNLAILGGSRAPSSSTSLGGLDGLVKILGPAIASCSDPGGPAAAPSKKKSKKATAAQAAVDLRSLAKTLAHQLVSTIASCQPDDDIFRPLSATYISVTLAVKDLARIIPGAPEADSDRMECVAAAYAFQMECTNDAHFSAFCVQKLAKSLSYHGNEAAQDRVLARPLPRPTRSAPTSPPRKSRSSPAGSYGGVFEDGTDNLTVFLRAMHPNCYGGLVTRLVELAESCYSNVGNNLPSDAIFAEHRRKKRRKDDGSQNRCVPACCIATPLSRTLTIPPFLF